MTAFAFSSLWGFGPADVSGTSPTERRRAPLFIGDAVQPWGEVTILAAILRDDARDAEDQSIE
jgi:hypothetical protein